ncbi:hypothetical protein ACKVEX_16380 [Rhodocyclaceae bacterium SMB388]
MKIQNASAWALLAYLATLGILPAYIGILFLLLSVLLVATSLMLCPSTTRPLESAKPILVILLSFVMIGGISVFIASLNELPVSVSLEAWMRLVIALVFFTGGLLVPEQSRWRFIKALMLVLVLHALVGITFYFAGQAPVIQGIPRASGALTPNVFANMMTVALFLSFSIMMDRVHVTPNLRRLAFFSFLVFLLALTLGATLKNIIVVAPILFLLFWTNSKSGLFGSKGLVGVVLVCTVIAAFLLYEPIATRAIETIDKGVHLSSLAAGEKPTSLQWRLMHWLALLEEWQDSYLLLGAGIGQTRSLGGIRAQSGGEGTMAHGDWVSFAIEYGVLLAPFVVSFFACVGFYIKKSRFLDQFGRRTLGAVFIGICLLMIGGNVFFSAGFLYVFWFLFGLLILNRPVNELLNNRRTHLA